MPAFDIAARVTHIAPDTFLAIDQQQPVSVDLDPLHLAKMDHHQVGEGMHHPVGLFALSGAVRIVGRYDFRRFEINDLKPACSRQVHPGLGETKKILRCLGPVIHCFRAEPATQFLMYLAIADRENIDERDR